MFLSRNFFIYSCNQSYNSIYIKVVSKYKNTIFKYDFSSLTIFRTKKLNTGAKFEFPNNYISEKNDNLFTIDERGVLCSYNKKIIQNYKTNYKERLHFISDSTFIGMGSQSGYRYFTLKNDSLNATKSFFPKLFISTIYQTKSGIQLLGTFGEGILIVPQANIIKKEYDYLFLGIASSPNNKIVISSRSGEVFELTNDTLKLISKSPSNVDEVWYLDNKENSESNNFKFFDGKNLLYAHKDIKLVAGKYRLNATQTKLGIEIPEKERAINNLYLVRGAYIAQGEKYAAFINLNILHTNDNQLTSLDLSTNTSLQYFYCENNQLISLSVPNTNTLLQMACDDNNLTSLDVSGRMMLNYLKCDHNSLQTINVSNCPALTQLICSWNQLLSLDVSSNINLEILISSFNQFTTIDVSSNINLTSAYFGYNGSLTSLNIANGQNTTLNYFSAESCGNLTCIKVDNPTNAANYTNWTKDAGASYNTNCPPPCTVNLPDANFKAYLVGNTLINTNGDTEIQCSEAIAFTGVIACANSNISDLTGIEAFTSVNQIYCEGNSLTTLDVSACTNLTRLECFSNSLSSLTGLGANLSKLRCEFNQLTTLDVSNSPNLYWLWCNTNQISTIDLSNNTALINLHVESNPFGSLDLSNNTLLEILNCGSTQLTNLNVSNNTALESVRCLNNSITNLNLSMLSSLTGLDCRNNQLTSLNLANGNNINFGSFSYNSTNNPNLTCIQVDDASYSTTNWTNIDTGVNFSLNCSSPSCTDTYSTDNQSGCGSSFTWIDGNTYTSNNTTAIHTIPNAAGCDSIITLSLYFIVSNTSVAQNNNILTANQSGVEYQWIDCNNSNIAIAGETNQTFTASSNGNYAVIINTNNVCYDTSSCYTVATVGIEAIDISNLPNGIYTAKVIIGTSKPIMTKLIKN